MNLNANLSAERAIFRLAQLQGAAPDAHELHYAVASAGGRGDEAPAELLAAICVRMGFQIAQPLREIDPALLPALVFHAGHGWGVVRGLSGRNTWIAQFFDIAQDQFVEVELQSDEDFEAYRLLTSKPFDASNSKVFALIKGEVFQHKGVLFEAAAGSILINVLMLAASFYSMQVYDRVIPTRAYSTLWVLTVGVMLAMLFEFAARVARSKLMEYVVLRVDGELSRKIFARLLSVRMDQMPQSVGSLSAQLRGYEVVRAFVSSSTLYLLVDVPFGMVFIALIGAIGGVYMALVPLVFLLLSLLLGFYYRGRVENHSERATQAGNAKMGLLVEVIEGAETIKSGGGGWRMLSRWLSMSEEARTHELSIREMMEHSQFIMGAVNQFSYVLLIAVGAYLVSSNAFSMGALIACSILSGRAFGPSAMIPGQLVQWAHAKAALRGLERFWDYQQDATQQERSLMPESIEGEFIAEDVSFTYPGSPLALSVSRLVIKPGERVGVIGPIGAGKTTLLRLLSGMYKPQAGRILLDGMDIAHIHRPILVECLAYLQQEGRLFAGTLRENLLLGIVDPGDKIIRDTCVRTGLQQLIQAHPKGLNLEIAEGGSGLSGGQRQLVNLTRLLLKRPSVWLLDEPTASMDEALEHNSIKLLRETLTPGHTLVLVTHKARMLELVDRLVVVTNHRVVLDGPRDAVLAKLNERTVVPLQAPLARANAH